MTCVGVDLAGGWLVFCMAATVWLYLRTGDVVVDRYILPVLFCCCCVLDDMTGDRHGDGDGGKAPGGMKMAWPGWLVFT